MSNIPPSPPKTNAAEDETITEERKRMAWRKPTIRHIGQTIYTGTGTKMNDPDQNLEQYSYLVASS